MQDNDKTMTTPTLGDVVADSVARVIIDLRQEAVFADEARLPSMAGQLTAIADRLEAIASNIHDIAIKGTGQRVFPTDTFGNPMRQKENGEWESWVIAAADRGDSMADDSIVMQWNEGLPPKHYAKKWFIAETTYGDRVVLKALPEEYSYDFKTADETYIKADKIKKWMQFPDSKYVQAAQSRAGVVRDGYKLVPIEPTPEMIEKGAEGMASFEGDSIWPDSWNKSQVSRMRMDAKKAYRAMVQAALGESNGVS